MPILYLIDNDLPAGHTKLNTWVSPAECCSDELATDLPITFQRAYRGVVRWKSEFNRYRSSKPSLPESRGNGLEVRSPLPQCFRPLPIRLLVSNVQISNPIAVLIDELNRIYPPHGSAS
jgi:hypothetical protein